jgi:uncharacterized membrane protein YbhN (UPF0104 family)
VTSLRIGEFFWRAAVLCALFVVAALNLDLAEFRERFTSPMLFAVLAVQPLMAVALLMAALRLWVLVGRRNAALLACIKSVLLSHGMNVVLVGRLSELLKVSYLAQHSSVTVATGVAALVLERVTDILIFVVLAAVAVQGYLATNMLLLLVAAITAAALWLVPRYKAGIGAGLGLLPGTRIREFAQDMLARFCEAIASGSFKMSSMIGIAGWACNFAGMYLMINALGSIQLPWIAVVGVFVAATIGGAAPALPGGFGTFEAGAVAVLSAYGYPFSEALSLAIAIHVSQLPISIIGALIVASRERLGVPILWRGPRDVP